MPLTPDVGVNFRVKGLDQVQRGLRIVKNEAEPTSKQWGTASRQIAGGLEQIARTGKVTGESLKQIVTQGANMAFMFGAGGPIVAALAITGVAIYEGITGRMKEAREEARRFKEDIAGLQRSGNMTGAAELSQRLFSGDKFAVQQDGESDRAFRARQLGVTGIQGEIGRLRGVVASGVGPRGEQLESSKQAQREITEWNRILPEFEQKARTAAAAANLLMAQFGGRLAAEAKATRPVPFTNELRFGRLDVGVFERMGLGADGKVSTPFLDPGSVRTRAGNPATSPATQGMVDSMRAVGEMAGRGFVDTLASTIEAGISKAFEKGANIGGIFAAMGQAALGGIGSMMIQIGKATLASFAFIEKIKTAIMTLNPAIGVAASIGLIALGSVLSAAGGRAAANAGGGGFGGGGGYGYSSGAGYGSAVIDRGIIDPTARGVTAQRPMQFNATFFGHRDPTAQREFQEWARESMRRGDT